MESRELKQRTNMNFCFKLGKMAIETHKMLVDVYGDATLSRKTVHKCLDIFVVVLNRLKTNNAQVVRRLRQLTQTCRKSKK
jgi:hypothetical protein